MLKAVKRVESFLFFLTILFLPTQLGRHFWPQFSYIYSLRVDYLSPTIYFWDVLVLGLLCIWLFQKPKFNKLALNLLLIFIFTQLFSLLTVSNLGAGLIRLEQYLISGILGIYAASQNWIHFKKKLLLPCSIGLIAESAIALGEVLKSGSLGLWVLGERNFSITTPAIAKFNFHGIEILRPYATFPHPNVLAAFLIIGLLLLQTRIKVINITTVIAIIVTFSRAAIMVAILMSFFLLRKRFLIGLIIGILVLAPLLYERFSSVFNFDNLTILRREELAKSAFELFLKNPLFGVGLNNFIPALSSSIISGPNRFLQPVHNIFLLSLSETGVIGVMGLIGSIGWPVYKFLRLYPLRFPLHPMLLIWGVIIFLGMFDHYFLTLPQGYRLLFLVWGISLSMLELTSE